MHLIYDTSTTFFHSGWNRVIIKSEYYAFEESFHQLETRLFPIFLSPHITFLRNIYVYLKELNLHRFNCTIAALYPFFEILRKSFKFQRVEIKSFLILKNKLLKIVISNSSVFQNESNRSDTRRHRREGGEEEAAFRKSSILGRRDEPVFQCSSSSSSSVSVSRAAGGALWPRARSYVTDFFPSDMGNLSARELFAYISRGSPPRIAWDTSLSNGKMERRTPSNNKMLELRVTRGDWIDRIWPSLRYSNSKKNVSKHDGEGEESLVTPKKERVVGWIGGFRDLFVACARLENVYPRGCRGVKAARMPLRPARWI